MKKLKSGWATPEFRLINVAIKKKDRGLKEQFVNGIKDDTVTEIIRELTAQ